MRRSLTRAEILRRKSDIAELFPRKAGTHRRCGQPKILQGPLSDSSSAGMISLVAELLAQLPSEDLQGVQFGSSLEEIASSGATAAVLAAAIAAKAAENFGLRGSVQSDGLKLIFVAKNIGVGLAGCDKVFVSPAKHLGCAVQRNRAKRLQREFYRHSRWKLRVLSQQAAIDACQQFAANLCQTYGISLEPVRLGEACLCFEQQMLYHWGFVVYRGAAEGAEATLQVAESAMLDFWPDATGSAFIAEWQRYQALLEAVPRALRKQWLQLLQGSLAQLLQGERRCSAVNLADRDPW